MIKKKKNERNHGVLINKNCKFCRYASGIWFFKENKLFGLRPRPPGSPRHALEARLKYSITYVPIVHLLHPLLPFDLGITFRLILSFWIVVSSQGKGFPFLFSQCIGKPVRHKMYTRAQIIQGYQPLPINYLKKICVGCFFPR